MHRVTAAQHSLRYASPLSRAALDALPMMCSGASAAVWPCQRRHQPAVYEGGACLSRRAAHTRGSGHHDQHADSAVGLGSFRPHPALPAPAPHPRPGQCAPVPPAGWGLRGVPPRLLALSSLGGSAGADSFSGQGRARAVVHGCGLSAEALAPRGLGCFAGAALLGPGEVWVLSTLVIREELSCMQAWQL